MSESNNFVTTGPNLRMTKQKTIEKIVRIVDLNTTEMQPDTAARHTVLQIATRGGLPLPAAAGAIDDALEAGLLVEEDGRYRVA